MTKYLHVGKVEFPDVIVFCDRRLRDRYGQEPTFRDWANLEAKIDELIETIAP